MDDLGGAQSDSLRTAVRKKRSLSSRRPRPEPQSFPESHDWSPLSSAPLSDDVSKVSSDDNLGEDNPKGKVFSLNQCLSRGALATTDEDLPHKKIKKEDAASSMPHCNGGLGDVGKHGHDVPSRHSVENGGTGGNENKLKKVKLKVGGITRTISAKTSLPGATGGTSVKSPRPHDVPRPWLNLSNRENSDADHSPSTVKKSGLQGSRSKDSSKGKIGPGKEGMGKVPAKHGDKPESTRKSKRVPKKRLLDGGFDEDDEDDEIRYLEKLKTISAYKDVDEESSTKHRSLSRVSKGVKSEHVESLGRVSKDVKMPRLEREDADYEEEEDQFSDEEPKQKKKQWKDSPDDSQETKREITLTTRQRALLSSKDASLTSGATQVEFPNGLPPPPPRKQKEKLSEVEQQLKKAEAAQRRRMQNEKAARESEAEAIRKILGQDSNRKKKEDKIKKRQEELAQEKAANAEMLASNTIRWVMGPTGTVVTFPQAMGLPHIFESKQCSYPPPREKCAGPSCTNPYKYRDSKSKLPLCSLQCYKAINQKMDKEIGC